MFSKAIQVIKHSIFPIFNTSAKSTGVLGTGFFIDDRGHFLTAAHVINALPKGAALGYLGNIPHSKFIGKKFITVEIIAKDDDKDLAYGKVTEDILPPLLLADYNPLIGESISLCGYPLPMITKSNNPQTSSSLDVTAVRQYWQPTIMMDSVRKDFLYKKKFHSFLTQHAALPGMSGGPIFNLEGFVIGVISANWTRRIPRPNGVNLNVENGIGIDLSEVNVFLANIAMIRS